jgi:hypothetical protein
LIHRKDGNLLQTAGWKTYDDLSFMDDGRQVLKRFAKRLCKTDLHRLRLGFGEYLCVCPGWMKTEARARGAQLEAQFFDSFGASGFGWKTPLYYVRIDEIPPQFFGLGGFAYGLHLVLPDLFTGYAWNTGPEQLRPEIL